MPTIGTLPQVYRAAGTLEYGSFALEPPTAGERADGQARAPLLDNAALGLIRRPGGGVPAT